MHSQHTTLIRKLNAKNVHINKPLVKGRVSQLIAVCRLKNSKYNNKFMKKIFFFKHRHRKVFILFSYECLADNKKRQEISAQRREK